MSVYGGVYGSSASTTPFATVSDMVEMFGEDFLRDYTNDQPSPDDSVERELLRAHQWLLARLLHRYTATELQGSSWVKDHECQIAGYYIALRRGQQPPSGVVTGYNMAVEDVDSIMNDTRIMIPDIPTRHLPGPNISNFEVDNRALRDRQRRQNNNSTSDHPGSRSSFDYDSNTWP